VAAGIRDPGGRRDVGVADIKALYRSSGKRYSADEAPEPKATSLLHAALAYLITSPLVLPALQFASPDKTTEA